MPYSNVLVKGKRGYNTYGWPLIIMERAKSDKPGTPVCCEVYGLEHECGSVYVEEVSITNDVLTWEQAVKDFGHNPAQRYFKGALL